MAGKLTEPVFEPVYRLDQSLDTILGYDHLQAEVHALSVTYPRDEHHAAVRQLADMSLTACREDEVTQARELTEIVKEAGIVGRVNSLGDIQDAKRRVKDQGKKLDALERVPRDLFASVLSEANPAERDTINEIVQRKIDKTQEEVEAAQSELSELSAGAESIKAILRRPILAKPTPLGEPTSAETRITTPDLLKQFLKITGVLRSMRSGKTYERHLVQKLYPELYHSDRPEAYRQFDVLYRELDTANASQYYEIAGGLIQRGKLYQANQAGRPIGPHTDIIYRIVSGDDKLLKSKGDVRQRLTVDDAPHVVAWNKVTPEWTNS